MKILMKLAIFGALFIGIHDLNADCQMNDGCPNQFAVVQKVCKNSDGSLLTMNSWTELMQGVTNGCHIDSKGNAVGLKPFSPRSPAVCPRCNHPPFYHTADNQGFPCGPLLPIYQETVTDNGGFCPGQPPAASKPTTSTTKK
jgi:hypothetical protein